MYEPHDVRRQSWTEFLLVQFFKVLAVIIMAVIFIIIYNLSHNEADPLQLSSYNEYLLLFLTLFLYITVLWAFTKIVALESVQGFNPANSLNYLQKNSVWYLLLVLLFVTAVYILLDASLREEYHIYLFKGPIIIFHIFDTELQLNISSIIGTGSNYYYSIRNDIFTILYVILFLVPLLLFFIILTRLGRKRYTRLQRTPSQEDESKRANIIIKNMIFLIIPIIGIFLFEILSTISMPKVVQFAILVAFLAIIPWWLFHLLRIISHGLRFVVHLAYSNVLWILPLVGFFYVLPVMIWTIWDVITSYSTITSINNLIMIILSSIYYNATNINRIFQAIFILVIGGATIAIGIAEGYSIIAIYRALRSGYIFTKTGSLAQQSPPVIAVITTRILVLAGWISLSMDSLRNIWGILQFQLHLQLPNFPIPPMLGIILELINLLYRLAPVIGILAQLANFLLPLTILLVPLFFIINSMFKFLSVTLITSKIHDKQLYMLLLSAAFILIITEIIADITELVNLGTYGINSNYPLNTLAEGGFLIWASNVFKNLEATFFYVGLLIALITLAKDLVYRYTRWKTRNDRTIILKIGQQDDEEE